MLVLFCMRGCGCIERPAFPAPSDFWADVFCKNSDASRREDAESYLMNANAPYSHSSSPGLTGRPSIPETHENNREAAAYWIVRSSRTMTAVWKPAKQSPVVPAQGRDDEC